MLEPWIIEQIRRREEERRQEEQRPRLELPVPDHWPARNDAPKDEADDEESDEPKRGVVIIGL